jgi:hypothetical protein
MYDPDIAYAVHVGGTLFCYLLYDKDGICLGSETKCYVEHYKIPVRSAMGNYNQTKVKIQFGAETMEVEGSPTEVKELSQMFFANVLELQKGMTVLAERKPEVIFK